MTNHWVDVKNADVILIMGSNAAENHPISFKWVTAAIEKGAKLISVDPRFTRTSSKAHLYAPIRPGTDIAFLGGMVKYILDNELYDKYYVLKYTNAAHLIKPDYAFHDGVFSGYNEEKRTYDKSSWGYQVDEETGIPKRDETLQDPQCVLNLLKKHYERYDLETVSQITGTPVEKLQAVYELYGSTGKPDKVATMMYAMGWTQHTVGTQMIRTATLVQSLLGNMGKAGGGINALRGESNVQGSTDQALLFHILPGYLGYPVATDKTLADYIARITPTTKDPLSANWKQNQPKYVVSLLKAWYGENATAENEFGFHWLSKNGGNYSWMSLFEQMYAGNVKGMMVFGQNPAVSSANSNMIRKAINKLDWLVVSNLWSVETANCWQAEGFDPADVQTEVFLLPAAASFEKQGSVTNSSRLAQWRYKAQEPLGEAKPDSWIINQLMLRLREMYKAEGGPNAEGILALNWNYGEDEPDVELVTRMLNGYYVKDVLDDKGNVVGKAGEQVKNFTALKDDGSTACTNWIYSGVWPQEGNMAARVDNVDDHPAGIGQYGKWGWAWPLNRRIIYNRASVDENGKPFDPKRWVIQWDPKANDGKGGWIGDVPDGGYPPLSTPEKGKLPFIMQPEGYARLFGMGLADGPFPEHYEPYESPVDNVLHPDIPINPVTKVFADEINPRGDRSKYPIIATTYRVTEHWQSGAMTRHIPWLLELQPEMFVEMSEELAAELGVRGGDKVIVESARGEVEGVAIVTKRFKPMQVAGQTVHVVGMPWHWGFMGMRMLEPGGPGTGDSANEVTVFMGDANTMIPESKALLCQVRKA